MLDMFRMILTSASDTVLDLAVSASDVASTSDVAATQSSTPLVIRLLGIILAGILTENYVLSKHLGCCPFLGASKKLDKVLGMSAAVTLVMVLATAVTYPIFLLLSICNIEYLETVIFVFVTVSLVQLLEIAVKRFLPTVYDFLGEYLPLVTTNCAVLGVALIVVEKYFGTVLFGEGYLAAICTALGAGAGFLVAMVLFSGVRSRMEKSDIPDFFKGLPITLVAAAIVALAFMGFSGVISGMGMA